MSTLKVMGIDRQGNKAVRQKSESEAAVTS